MQIIPTEPPEESSVPHGESLDERVTAAVRELAEAGRTDDAEALNSSLAYIREAWRGADTYESLAAALQRIAENAEDAAEILMRTLEPTPPPTIG